MKKPGKLQRNDRLLAISKQLKEGLDVLQEKQVTSGFDGFVDAIVRIIKTKNENSSSNYFRTKKDFAKYILEKGESSFSLELDVQSTRIGGNMPIMANALATLGTKVNCIGTLGHPQNHPVFKNLHSRCHLFSFADPGFSTAYEFSDGKILLASMGELNTLDWQHVKNLLGFDTLVSAFQKANLVSLVNWSEIGMSTDIWRGIINEVIPNYAKTGKNQIAFFDLADCSKRSSESIREVLSLIAQFAKYTKVILGLNTNETNGIYKVLFGKKPKKELGENGDRIFEKLGIDILLLHSSREAIALCENESFTSKSFFVKHPVISTGAGDNFNAGFCAGQLLNMNAGDSLILAHAVSGIFVQTGKSPTLREVVNFLEALTNQKKKVSV